MKTSNMKYGIDILINGESVDIHRQNGKGFIEGKMKSEYSIMIFNHCHERVLVSISIDGLSIMDGKPELIDGYLLSSFDAFEIPGWKLSDNRIANFLFGLIPESYAKQKRNPEYQGIIRAVFFEEKSRPAILGPRKPKPIFHSFAYKSLKSAYAPEIESRVRLISFNGNEIPSAEILIHYDRAEALRRQEAIIEAQPAEAAIV